jgi:hypothetical protein
MQIAKRGQVPLESIQFGLDLNLAKIEFEQLYDASISIFYLY